MENTPTARRTVLKTLGATLAVGGGIGIAGASEPTVESETFVYRAAESVHGNGHANDHGNGRAVGHERGNAPAAGGGGDCKETGEWKRFTGATWPDGTTIDYDVQSTPDLLSSGSAHDEIVAAFETWDDHLGPIGFGSDTPGANNVVTTDSLDRGTLARTTVWYTPNELRRFKITFSTNPRWGVSTVPTTDCSVDGDFFDVQSVAAHEVGHAIGLGHPNNADAHTMWAYASKGETYKRTLAKGDLNGVSVLY